MSIPDFQSLMLPLLQYFADGQDHTGQETYSALAEILQLTEAERHQLLPSGRQVLFANRISWAKHHLKQAGLLVRSQRSVYHITERGQDVLRNNPTTINLRYLAQQFSEYKAYRALGRAFRTTKKAEAQTLESLSPNEMTPQEHIEYGYQQIRAELAADLLARITACPPDFFERLVIELLLAMGYGGSRQDAGKAVGKGGDGGIDGIIKEDRLGLDVIYIQAKRWEAIVGRPEVQKFAGALQGQRARKGIFITTSSFTKEADAFAASIDSKIVLLDGEELAALMIDHEIGVTNMASYAMNRVDTDYFTED